MNTIDEVLYLVQHSTGVKLCRIYRQIVEHYLHFKINQQELVNDLIVMVHKNSRNYRLNPNLYSYDW